jgi:hypothetical protein
LSKDQSEKGKSWNDPEKDPLPPQTVYDPQDFKVALLNHLQVDEEEFLGRYGGRQRQEIEGEQFAEYERQLARRHDPTVAYHVARLVWHLDFVYQEVVLELSTEFFYDFFQEADCWKMIDVAKYQPKKIPSKAWQDCIKKIYEVDPLSCPHCGQEMQIINFISEFPVIRQIIEHLAFWVMAPRDPPKQEPMPELVCEPFADGWPGYEAASFVMN